jgi:hypothetical protein
MTAAELVERLEAEVQEREATLLDARAEFEESGSPEAWCRVDLATSMAAGARMRLRRAQRDAEIEELHAALVAHEGTVQTVRVAS